MTVSLDEQKIQTLQDNVITFNLNEGDRIITNLAEIATLNLESTLVSASDCGTLGFKNLDLS